MTTMHPKVRAAAATTPAVAILAYLLRLVGVDVDAIPAEVLLLAAGTLTTFAAWLRRAGLRGAVNVLLDGQPTESAPAHLTATAPDLPVDDRRADQLRRAWLTDRNLETAIAWEQLQPSEQERWRREAAGNG